MKRGLLNYSNIHCVLLADKTDLRYDSLEMESTRNSVADGDSAAAVDTGQWRMCSWAFLCLLLRFSGNWKFCGVLHCILLFIFNVVVYVNKPKSHN